MSTTISNVPPTVPNNTQTVFVDKAVELSKGLGLDDKTTETVKHVVGLLAAEASLRIDTNAPLSGVGKVGTPTGATGVPALDFPDDQLALQANLEELILHIQIEKDKVQAELAAERLELQKDGLETRHKEQIEKLEHSLEEMDKAAKAAKAARALSIALTALAVAMAAILWFIPGVGTALAVAATVAAAAAVTATVLAETGVMDDFTELISDWMKEQHPDWSDEKIQTLSQLAAGAPLMVVQLGCAVASIASAVKGVADLAVSAAMRTVQSALSIASETLGVGNTIAGGVATGFNYEAGLAQADVTDADQFIALMRQRLEECQEELQAILQQIQNNIGKLTEIIQSENDTKNEIAGEIGNMTV